MISYVIGYWTLFHSTNCGAWLQERPWQGGKRTKTRRCQQDAKCALVAIAEALLGMISVLMSGNGGFLKWVGAPKSWDPWVSICFNPKMV